MTESSAIPIRNRTPFVTASQSNHPPIVLTDRTKLNFVTSSTAQLSRRLWVRYIVQLRIDSHHKLHSTREDTGAGDLTLRDGVTTSTTGDSTRRIHNLNRKIHTTTNSSGHLIAKIIRPSLSKSAPQTCRAVLSELQVQ